MDVTIVPTAAEHVIGFRCALDQVARERKYLAMFEAPPLQNMQNFVAQNIADGHTQRVALVADQVVGWCDILPKALPVHAHCGVLGMGVLAEFRGKGIGKRLLAAALEHALPRLNRVELTVNADNAPAIALYERVGFVLEGTMRDALAIDGKYQDALLMALVDHSGRTSTQS
jgi:RimJ/RimL family protein N-acetyltransferase